MRPRLGTAVFIALGALLLTACSQPQPSCLYIVALADMSASIHPDSAGDMLNAVESMIGSLRRGDTLAIIPVTNDADIDLSGHVLRFKAPTKREAYDYDLTRMKAEARERLSRFRAEVMNRPGARTDLLRSVRAASEELASVPSGHPAAVMILSDFIQDDAQFCFETDPNLATPPAARTWAAKLSERENHRFPGTPILLGTLRSRDLGRLSRARREAIRQFWIEYLTRLGARPQWITDGPGLAPRFLNEVRSAHGR